MTGESHVFKDLHRKLLIIEQVHNDKKNLIFRFRSILCRFLRTKCAIPIDIVTPPVENMLVSCTGSVIVDSQC